MVEKLAIFSEGAPPAVGPYAQAIKLDEYIYVSGQMPLDNEGKHIVGRDIATQTDQCIKNIQALLQPIGGQLMHILKITVYLKDIKDAKAMNEAYKKHFQFNPPARSLVAVADLPFKGVLIEMDAVAFVPDMKKQGGVFF